MRKILALAVCSVFLFAATAHADLSIAVFDLQDVAAKSDVLKEGQAAVNKAFKPRKDKLDKDAEVLKGKADAVAKGATEAQRTEFLNLQRAYNESATAYMDELQKAELRIRQDVDLVILEAAKKYAKKKGYNLILDSNSALYFEDSMDVTKEMLTEVNAQWRSMKK